MRKPDLSSESGLRPLSAIVVIAFVVLMVMLRVTVLALGENGGTRVLAVLQESGMEPAYNIEDQSGTPLAVFLERLDLVMSPQSMWQAHTPDYMAVELADQLGPEVHPSDLLARMIPDAVNGVITVDRWEIDEDAAHRIDRWIRGEGEWEREAPGHLPGIGFETESGMGPRLSWKPVELLSRETRATYGKTTSPTRWTRSIADALGTALFGPLPEAATDAERTRRRDEIWSGLMPTKFCRAALSISPERALPLSKLMRSENVEPIQMSLASTRSRTYPSGDFPVLGQWGFTKNDQLEPEPYGGLESLCDSILGEEEWSWIEPIPGSYEYRRERPARLKLRPYFMGRVEGTGAPTVRMTMDVSLQRFLRERLQRVMADHEPAVAMAIAVELATGNVLAVDGVHAYGMAAFPPVKHQFMPGSTFKIVTMATALEAQVVRPEDTFEVGTGEWPLVVGDRTRTIHEAEGSKHGRITASESLAYSVNAGLVQIGMQIPAEYFHDRLVNLGYGRRVNAKLGGEERGLIPELPWTRLYAHASVCYGYEVSTTLWQHMQALTTILRGGVFKELRIADSISHEGHRYELQRGEPSRLFERGTCATVRGMMELGAREGTGKGLYRDDIVMGTKTGTAERVKTEVCLHVYGRAAAALREAGEPVTSNLYRELRGVRKEHQRCHTSSIVAVGRRRGDEREIAVFVVVDEPRVGGHFGSKVAGPAAMEILVEALGLTRNGEETMDDLVPGFAASTADPGVLLPDEAREQPWNARATW